jgi:hypothetical protein
MAALLDPGGSAGQPSQAEAAEGVAVEQLAGDTDQDRRRPLSSRAQIEKVHGETPG